MMPGMMEKKWLYVALFCMNLPTVLLAKYLTINGDANEVYTKMKSAGKVDNFTRKYGDDHIKLTYFSALQHRLEIARININAAGGADTDSSYSDSSSSANKVGYSYPLSFVSLFN